MFLLSKLPLLLIEPMKSPDRNLRWFFKFRAVSFLLLLSWHSEWLFHWPTPVLLILKDLKQIPQKADWRSVLTEVTQGWSFPQAFSYLQVPGISWSIWIIIIHLETEWRNLPNNLQLTWEFKQVKTTEDTQKDIRPSGRPSSTLVSFRGQPQTKFSKGQCAITCSFNSL